MRIETKIFLNIFLAVAITAITISMLFGNHFTFTGNAIRMAQGEFDDKKVVIFIMISAATIFFLTAISRTAVLKPIKEIRKNLINLSPKTKSSKDEIGKLSRDVSKIIQNIEDYKEFLDSVNDLVQSVNAKGYFVYVNKKWIQTLGYSLEEAKKMHYSQIIKEEELHHCNEIFRQLGKNKEFQNVKTFFLTKNKKEVPVEGNISAKVKNGSLLETRGIFRDVSEKERIEKENKRIYDLMIERELKMSELKKQIKQNKQ